MAKKFLYVDSAGDYTESINAFEVADHINVSTGAADAAKPIVLDAGGKIDPSMISFNSLSYKAPSRVASVAAVDITSAPASIDGVTLSNGDRVLIKDGSTANSGVLSVDNGIYVFNGTASAMTRSSDMDQDSEMVAGSITVIEEGTVNDNRSYMIITDNIIIVGTTPVQFGIMPQNLFSAGDGIAISGTNIISVDILDTGSGLEFAGGGTDELAIDFATVFVIDGADDLAAKASDYASTTVGDGAARVGISDASNYYTGNNVEAAFDELEAQLGGDTSSTFNFTEDNVLTDDSSIYSSLNDLDLKWGDLASTTNGEGASLVSIEDSVGLFTATDVEGALAELAGGHDSETFTAGEALVAGDLVYFSANSTVSKLSISSGERAVGCVLVAAANGTPVRISMSDEIAEGAVVGSTAGTRLYWSGTALTPTIPAGSGSYVHAVGIAVNATDILTKVDFIKKNS